MSARSKIAALQAKLAAYTAEVNAKIAELEVEASTEVNTDLAVPGAEVTFTFGRKDNAKSYVGTVLGRKTDEKGRATVKVQVGTGFEAEIFAVGVAAITRITAVAAVAADPAEGDAQAE